MSIILNDLPCVNVELYDGIDNAALDVAMEFENRLDELGISVPDEMLEQLYDSMLRIALYSVEG